MTKVEQAALLEHHLACAENHTNLAQCSKALADHHTGLREHTELTDRAASQMHAQAAETCTKMAGHHASLAESHVAMHKAIGELSTEELESHRGESHDIKALVLRLDKFLDGTLAPSNVSINPRTPNQGGRPLAVPRPGQQDLSKIDPALRVLIADANPAME